MSLIAVTPDAWCLVPVVSAGLSTLCQLLCDYHDNTAARHLSEAKGEKSAKLIFNQQNHFAEGFN